MLVTANGNGKVSTADLIARIEQHTGRAGRKAGREIVLICPHHEGPDSTPSLNVREGDGGYPLIRCRSAGCTPEQVLAAVGYTWSDVFGDDSDHWTPGGPWVAVYDYNDADGTLLSQVCRTADKQFYQRQPDPQAKHGFTWNLNGGKRVPYHLPQLLDAVGRGETIYICDGEKDVQALERAGVTATCCSGGALKWPQEFARFFVGATVRVIVDQDPLSKNGKPHAEGQRAALQIATFLGAATDDILLLAPKEGKDAADHLGAGYGVDDLKPVDRMELASTVQSAPPDVGGTQETEGPGGAPVLRFASGREFIEQVLQKIDPLFGETGDALMMPGSLMLLAGIGGAGKTTLSLHMMAHFAAGLPWFGIEVARPIRCVVIENEGPHDPYVEKVKTFTERFHGCTCSGEPHGNDSFLDNICFLDAPWGRFTFEDSGLARDLNDQMKAFGGDLLVANPLGRLGMKGAGTPEETRAFLALLDFAGLGADFAALLLHHLAKVQQNTPLVQQVSGDWGPHPDTIMVMESAGERRSKLSFGKVRWGDQGRPPMILNWLTDPEGPVGYATSEVVKGVTTEELVERVDRVLREQAEPQGITAIRDAAHGKSTRIKQILDQGVEEGRYATSGGQRPTFWLRGAEGTQDVIDYD